MTDDLSSPAKMLVITERILLSNDNIQKYSQTDTCLSILKFTKEFSATNSEAMSSTVITPNGSVKKKTKSNVPSTYVGQEQSRIP